MFHNFVSVCPLFGGSTVGVATVGNANLSSVQGMPITFAWSCELISISHRNFCNLMGGTHHLTRVVEQFKITVVML